ncbi:vacuolar protein sorting-associated protein 52 homolog [Sinocyclocheilus anshuiensis]|uniref:vacuolar protein sorting-associated protein 52 homolog n=1 Tax=Sinocyclocheilus anshuiensis TaxID=1608454 RepID=UPI0007B98671|nr:PREDICTED: vacuolar protein sorting-associated protein 52 homolog [Sinocyclocheilus anshuiensis]
MAEALIPAAELSKPGADSAAAAGAMEKSDFEAVPALNLGDLDITTDEFILDEVDIHIQANLEDDLVKEALKTGVDLRQYSKQVETELQRIEQASIKDYIKESQNIASLHNQITACDSILERMEGMLSSFQSDLSSISSEIQTLQQQSVSMNLRLKNRQAVRSQLSQLVDELVVPSTMISVILDSPVTEQEFLEQLHELNSKINYAKELSFRETLACSDIQDIVDRLKMKAVSKIREFILQKIYSFRKPMTNYQIPQNTLLKFRFFYQFLLANERTVAKEIRDEYVDTMSKIYFSYFKSYSGRLLKVQITRRYAEFSSAVVSINQTFPNERTIALLGQLQVEVENFVLKMAAEFPSRRDQLIFLINNYDMMLGVLMERAADDSKEVEGFQQLLLARTQEFIEEILSPPFGGMITFVKESEALMEKGQLDKLRTDEARITQLVRGFSSSWKQSVEALSQDVMRSFTNFKNGTSIIQGALTQLIQYYHGFHKVLSQPTFRSLAVRSELINLHHLMVEVKKHKPNF